MNLNEELKKISVDGLQQLGDWIHQAKDFAVEQAPLFAQEYVKWWIADNAIGAVVYFVLLAVTLFAMSRYVKKIWAWAKEEDTDGSCIFAAFIVHASFVALSIIFLCCAASDCKEVAKGYFAPRVVIVEGISEIVHNSQPINQGK